MPFSSRAAAADFAHRWRGRGFEKSDTHSFWLDLCANVLGMESVTTSVLFESRTVKNGWIDALIPDAKTFIEQKSAGIDLDKPELRQGRMVTPFEQAKAYADAQPNSQRPDTIIVCNFESFRIHSLNDVDPANNYDEFLLEELPEQLYLLSFLVDPQSQRARREKAVSLTAGAKIGQLHSMLRGQYIDPDAPASQHSLNVLLVRIVFCLYAEDAGLFKHGAFGRYIKASSTARIRVALNDLFEYLDTPDAKRDPYSVQSFDGFPYVNGGLFADHEVEIPNFTEEIKEFLVTEVSESVDWSHISPTIFGGVFESTLNPETRHEGGMHYTSPENIHRVIDPLFLDDLRAELEQIVHDPELGDRARHNRLRKYQEKLASLTFFDAAAGSGNFLTETYISLRRLENKVISELAQNQTFLVFDQVGQSPIKVTTSQFYGIEVNDFAVAVARAALWIAKLQADQETEIVLQEGMKSLPLKNSPNIVHANALELDWKQVLAPEKCSYLIGNPPFIGYSRLTASQKADRARVFGKKGGNLDYVACWYRLAADYMEGTTAQAALVSTNSITQGQQVQPLWEPLMDRGVVINFAHRTFRWRADSADPAAVHVVIVGFSFVERSDKKLFTYRADTLIETSHPEHINAYLAEAPDVFITRRRNPVCDVPAMSQGFKPADGGNLILSPEEREELLAAEPQAEKWIRPFSMGAEFINGKDRYCLWLPEITPSELNKLPHVRDYVQSCRGYRLAQIKTGDAYKLADRPHIFRPAGKFVGWPYIGVPQVSSERRDYIPMGFVDNGMIPGNMLYFVPTDSRFIFGMLMSRVHNAWMRVVGGRLKSDYRYANTIVYNNFVFPTVTDTQREEITGAAQGVIDARKPYLADGATLADLYDPDNSWLYADLTKAHQRLDELVERAYGLPDGASEEEIVQLLFQLYAEATKK
ncbi:class I SAM-dependent DNA methyltransferase [Gleimia hominis]|uniref:site-specific DNA-methyltransferase (adenine-specific) n=1 Tax=Gleimia hominis TaxID=595468 RepID=A0ABU3ICF0_9ACTO|nr:DNA methyltransferase [Gleimia hominis]MDT3768053.1 class I SAM-dependent DNA methyltransferase [Gleimia hominis]